MKSNKKRKRIKLSQGLKAERNKSYYKSTDAWLDAVYENNKEIIDKAMAKVESVMNGRGTTREAFKEHVNQYIRDGYSPTKAVKTLRKSVIFTSEAERLRNNMYSALKQDKDAYQEFRNLTKEKGKYTEIDFDKFKWDKDQHMYIYKGQVGISFVNSPQGIIVTML